MTYVETSAVVAILLDEPESREISERINAADNPVTCIVSKVEMAISLGRTLGNYQRGSELVDHFLNKAGIKVLPVTDEIYQDVVRAYARFGKGTGHRAKLNFGDCFSYAVAKSNRMTLIYKGNDFAQTDLGTTRNT